MDLGTGETDPALSSSIEETTETSEGTKRSNARKKLTRKTKKETLRKIFVGKSIEEDPQEVFQTVQEVEDTYVSHFESNDKVDSAPIIRGEEVDSEGFGAIAPAETERVFK